MKLKDTIIFYSACALTFVGIYEAMVRSISAAYPFFMFATALLFWYLYRKLQVKQQKAEEQKDEVKKKPWDPKKKK